MGERWVSVDGILKDEWMILKWIISMKSRRISPLGSKFSLNLTVIINKDNFIMPLIKRLLIEIS